MNIHLDIQNDGVYRLTFDRPDSAANIFDRHTLEELDAHLATLSGDTRMRGLLLASAKDSIFVAGADIRELLKDDRSDDELRAIVREGQRIFNRIADLNAVTVALIHGACLGGGFELALACDVRLATRDRATRIGLPETALGILPAWGGCTRLPRLVGVPRALDAILGGKRYAAEHALKLGLVDELAPREHLLQRALQKIDEGKPRRRPPAWVNLPVVARIIGGRVRAEVQRRTRGHYPAVLEALAVITGGIGQPREAAQQAEEQALVRLARTDVCRQLVRLFFLQERAKRLSVKDRIKSAEFRPAPVQTAAVLGAGVMGAGIAQWLSARGLPVILRDINEEQVRKGLEMISKSYADAVKRRLLSPLEARQGLDRVSPAGGEVPMGGVDLVIEAAVEEMALKKTLFARMREQAGPAALLATNTSALSVSELGAAAGAPERVIGLHFFNPVASMQLVEVVEGDRTAPESVERALKFVQRIGKLPVLARDRPGFIVNRILMPYLIEAGHLFEQGASIRAIDEAMLEFGMPMGPLRLLDEVGVDVARHVAAFFVEAFPDRFPVPALLAGMIEARCLGRKTGAGFYLHPKNKRAEPKPNPAVSRWVAGHAAAGWSPDRLQERMVLLMVNEAARCLEERVAATPADIDFAMVMGTGFAPFRGGPLRYADQAGLGHLADQLARLAREVGPRFTPCDLLRRRADQEERFYGKE
jgi:3-hydroxyacyl-CoA dehydrogenase/enoyl-CoA hydratase/3-hydroxybutyryl-CoA epimerase